MTTTINIIHGDGVRALEAMEENQFDLAIVDPPYGIGMAKRNGSIGQKKGQGKITKYKYKEWDNSIPDKDYFKELFRATENQIIWGANYFTKYMPKSAGWIVYDKLQPEGVTFAMAELAYSSFNISINTFKTSRANMQNVVSNNKKIGLSNAKTHPTQKPIQLYKWLLKNYAKPGDKIIDTHGGSMSHAIAAIDMGFSLDIYEIDDDYYHSAVERIKRHVSQLDLSRPLCKINYITN